MATLHIDIVSAAESMFSGEAEFVVLPGESGELGILPNHAPLLTRIRPGMVRVRRPGVAGEERIYVDGGLLEVQPRVVTVLADAALRAQSIEEARAKLAQRSEEAQHEAARRALVLSKVDAELKLMLSRLTQHLRPGG